MTDPVTWLSIDGGNEKETGCACYVAGWNGPDLASVEAFTLEDCREFSRAFEAEGGRVDCVAVERHQFDGRMMRGETTPATMIGLAWNTAAVAYTLARGAPVLEYTVAEWIGNQNKVALHSGIWAALTPAEREIVARFGRHLPDGPRSRKRGKPNSGTPADVAEMLRENARRKATGQDLLKHDWFNVLDAVGVGLFRLGRIGKGAAPIRRAATLKGSE